MNTEVRVGTFIVFGLFLLAVAIFRLGEVSLSSQYPLIATFRDVAGLPDKSVVKLSGVEIGKVRRISLQGDRAVIEMRIRDEIKIFKDAKFRIGATSIIGSKYLQIDQGRPESGILTPGSSVAGEEALPLERMMADALKSIQGLIDGLGGGFGKNGSIMKDMEASVRNVRELTANMNDLLADVKPHLKESMGKMDSITDKLDTLLARSNELMAKLNSSTGTVGALVSDPEMKEQVKQTVVNFRDASASVKDTLGRMNQFKVYWDFTARQEGNAGTKGDVGLKIAPRDGRYYYLGGSNFGSKKDAARGRTDYEEKNTINALLGWEWERAEFYAGVLRSAFGVGGRVKPFYQHPVLGRFSLFGQAYDLGRNRAYLGRRFNNPVYDAGAEVQVHKIVRLGARVQDIAEVRRLQGTANIMFEDKDIAYLFGLVTFASAGTKGRSSN